MIENQRYIFVPVIEQLLNIQLILTKLFKFKIKICIYQLTFE